MSDIITYALIGALGKVVSAAVQDAYAGLKALLLRKFGKDSELVKSVEQLEQNPDSKARKAVVEEEVAKSKAHQDEELLAAAGKLLELLKAAQPQASVTQKVKGDGNIFSGTGNVTVTR